MGLELDIDFRIRSALYSNSTRNSGSLEFRSKLWDHDTELRQAAFLRFLKLPIIAFDQFTVLAYFQAFGFLVDRIT
jgi:hypothetical protein